MLNVILCKSREYAEIPRTCRPSLLISSQIHLLNFISFVLRVDRNRIKDIMLNKISEI